MNFLRSRDVATAPVDTGANGRDELVDFLRGLIIIDMMMVHFSRYLPEIARSGISYTDIAMEGFLVLAGFMTGRHYLAIYLRDSQRATKKLLSRAAKLLLVQYILIFTASVPQYAMSSGPDVGGFVLDSILFRNQVGLMHILPLFIALSLVSPVLLWMAARGQERWLAGISAVIFAAATVMPRELGVYEAVFPIALWQAYFVLGFCVGTASYRGTINPLQVTPGRVAGVGALLLIALACKHGGVVLGFLPDVSKFPLSAGGFLFGISLFATVAMAVASLWGWLATTPLPSVINVLGRNSLLVFAMHTYVAKLLETMWALGAGPWAVAPLIALNFAACYAICVTYETATTPKQTAVAAWPLRSLRFLFG